LKDWNGLIVGNQCTSICKKERIKMTKIAGGSTLKALTLKKPILERVNKLKFPSCIKLSQRLAILIEEALEAREEKEKDQK
jgi:hypothetical protein